FEEFCGNARFLVDDRQDHLAMTDRESYLGQRSWPAAATYRIRLCGGMASHGPFRCDQRASRGGRPARNDLNLSSDLRDLPSSIEARSSTTALAIVMGTTSDCD